MPVARRPDPGETQVERTVKLIAACLAIVVIVAFVASCVVERERQARECDTIDGYYC
jgi:uncharacterized membrane protein